MTNPIRQILEGLVFPMVGPRCESKDTHDFPEIIDDPKAERCLTCAVYEEVDQAETALNAYVEERERQTIQMVHGQHSIDCYLCFQHAELKEKKQRPTVGEVTRRKPAKPDDGFLMEG